MEKTTVRRWEQKGILCALLCMVMALFLFVSTVPAFAAGGLDLTTDYPGISVKPGDNLNIPIQINNTSGSGMNVKIEITSLPEGWDGYIQGGSFQINTLHVKSGENEDAAKLHITVPKELSEGTYYAEVQASGENGVQDSLKLTFEVTTAKAGAGSFTSEYPKQEGASGTSFSFSTTLINNSLTSRSYSLSSNAPAGWKVSFTPSGESAGIAGIDMEAGESKGINISVVPPENIEAGTYDVSCSAVSSDETLNADLQVVITGTYGLKVTTPDGRLSFDAHSNQNSDVTLNIINTGNVDLNNVSVNSSVPSGWSVTYSNLEDNMIESIPAGTTVEVIAHVKPGKDTITGDYAATFTAGSSETTGSADFRVSVKTSTLWGIVAILIILATAGGLGYVFRKYGRR